MAKGKNIAYVRVSTTDQNEAKQATPPLFICKKSYFFCPYKVTKSAKKNPGQ